MVTLEGYYDGKTFVPLENVILKPNQKVIITALDEFVAPASEKTASPDEEYSCEFGDNNYPDVIAIMNQMEKFSTYEW